MRNRRPISTHARILFNPHPKDERQALITLQAQDRIYQPRQFSRFRHRFGRLQIPGRHLHPRLIEQVDRLLDQARRQWAGSRRQGGDFRPAHQSIEQALECFTNRTYRHEQLSGDQSLAHRINSDASNYREAQRLCESLLRSVAGNGDVDPTTVRTDFDRLRELEEQLLRESEYLAHALGRAIPAASERAPRQHRVLQRIVEQANELARRLKEDHTAGVVELERYNQLVHMLHSLDPTDNVGLKRSVETL